VGSKWIRGVCILRELHVLYMNRRCVGYMEKNCVHIIETSVYMDESSVYIDESSVYTNESRVLWIRAACK
jgi:hypothetical protein